jgi:hypothetical protein
MTTDPTPAQPIPDPDAAGLIPPDDVHPDDDTATRAYLRDQADALEDR